ncbi:aminoacyl-tRNA hydrolase [Sporosarcina pasteurii]|uniref:Peptidyl-tRNA hydrolase n=1 Tax=Sporosarcina pasteurii TaxID=1474 RepID=A0A380BAS2_SPOPA|nr:aminoacyl-tRNA hydrolase [Sporosarcina pasteurii]MDS9473291.1 aminoacyl-tRNA hydrolase [Sporosarcina pasteurii]QBQ06521.1 aminoacyl-tRNA hydrolase [Sporosarcina pasteurii]SUI98260.1 Peptidyl-tRNA hydrolase [Sporosarcina pasteurii]
MKMIIGLGNPGKQYESTRHNIGFHVIDELADRLGVTSMQSKFNGMYTIVHQPEGKVMLVKPLTYMNLSGECVRPLMDYYDVEVEDIIVLYDDLDFAPGELKLRQKGSAGGHNGMKSLIAHLGTDKFKRIRLGIGRPTNGMKVSDYVLSSFGKEELPLINEMVDKSADACMNWLKTPFLEVMNQFN